jgi:hypothetical protein
MSKLDSNKLIPLPSFYIPSPGDFYFVHQVVVQDDSIIVTFQQTDQGSMRRIDVNRPMVITKNGWKWGEKRSWHNLKM